MRRAALAAGLLALAALPAAAQNEVAPAHAACETCGVIRSIREVSGERPVPRADTAADPRNNLAYVTGQASPALVGPSISSTWGAGKAGSAVGARGSDLMLDQLRTVYYEVIVRLTDGSYIRVDEPDASDLRMGDRVKVVDGRVQLVP